MKQKDKDEEREREKERERERGRKSGKSRHSRFVGYLFNVHREIVGPEVDHRVSLKPSCRSAVSGPSESFPTRKIFGGCPFVAFVAFVPVVLCP